VPAPSSLPCSELEARLASKEGASIKQEYLHRLHLLDIRLRAYLRAGPSPVNYEKSSALAKAVETAITIMEQQSVSSSSSEPSAPHELSTNHSISR